MARLTVARLPDKGAGATGVTGQVSPKRSWFWVQGLACGVLVTTAAPLVLAIVVLLAPSLLAALADPPGAPKGGRSALARIMLVYGLTVGIPSYGRLWAGAQSWAASLDTLADVRFLGMVWGAQGTAWLFSQLAPLTVRLVLEGRVAARAARLRTARTRLQAEWGLSAGPAEEAALPTEEGPAGQR